MSTISGSTNLFTELTDEESDNQNGGLGEFAPYDFSGYYNGLYSNFPISGFDPSLMWGIYQGSFPLFNDYLNTTFLTGGSFYDGLNGLQNLVNWANSPIV